MEKEIKALRETRDPYEKVAELKQEISSLESSKIFGGILLAFLSAGLIGVAFVLDILPRIAEKATHAVYDSDEMIEKDIMHDARALFAQGEYEACIEAYRQVAEQDPDNRFPWVEIAKIQKDNLDDVAASIATLREALEHKEWEANDAAFFMFRLAELYDQNMEDRESARSILEQVIELLPETRHSANARHKLNEWERDALEHPEMEQLEPEHPDIEAPDQEESDTDQQA